MLSFSNVSYGYGKGPDVLSDISFSLAPGTVCGLLGPNGAGKSTLLYLICGMLSPRTGTVDFNGFSPRLRQPQFLSEIYLLPEEVSLPAIPLESFIDVNAPFYPAFDREAMERHLKVFNLTGPIHLANLSMGQKKKVAISFALACNIPLLLLDEPTNGLDITAKRNFRSAVARAMTDDKTIIISTHQVHDVESLLDHVTVLDRQGILLNRSIPEITSRLAFNFTTDRERADRALIRLDVPGGYNIAERIDDPEKETEVNLETLFELVQQSSFKHNPDL